MFLFLVVFVHFKIRSNNVFLPSPKHYRNPTMISVA